MVMVMEVNHIGSSCERSAGVRVVVYDGAVLPVRDQSLVTPAGSHQPSAENFVGQVGAHYTAQVVRLTRVIQVGAHHTAQAVRLTKVILLIHLLPSASN